MKASKRSTLEALIFLTVMLAIFGVLGHRMGSGNMLKTMMNTAHDLLLNTVFYLMGITVLTGALSKLMAEFGVVTLLEKILRPLIRSYSSIMTPTTAAVSMTTRTANTKAIASTG